MKIDTTISIGVVGVGHLGNYHLKQLKSSPQISISGIYDDDPIRADKMSNQHNVHSFSSLKGLLDKSQAVSVVTPTNTHYAVADKALNAGCHLFIEKPITDNINHAKSLLSKAKDLNKIIQVGHIERFNPAFNILKKMKLNPQFIEVHRLSEFNIRGNDVPVILDLMIHDLDIILSLVQSEIKEIHANGVRVISSTPDIANARIEFKNSCVANLTASRISQKNMRKMRLFQKQDYITIDFQKGSIEEFRVSKIKPNIDNDDILVELEGEEKKYIRYHKPYISQYDALKKELSHFIDSIRNARKPETDGESAAKALRIALEIQNIIDK